MSSPGRARASDGVGVPTDSCAARDHRDTVAQDWAPQSAKAAARGRVGFVIAIAATVLTMVAASAPSPFYPQIASDLGLAPVATTFVFAVYAFTLLAALLCLGSLSDHVGRRAVISVGEMLLAASLVAFWLAGDLAGLLLARGLQGAAAGVLIPAMSAAVIDLEPPSRPGSAALWNTVGPMLGLAVGSLGSAVLLDIAADPGSAVFGGLAAASASIALLVWASPRAVPKEGVRLRDLRPQFEVPSRLRPLLAAAVPAIVAGWATNGLFLALGAGLVRNELGGTSHTQAGIAISALAASGIVASRVLQRRSARTISLYATATLALGTGLSIGALALHSYPAYVASVAVVGSGFGTAFLGVLRTLMPQTEPAERAAVMAVVYTIAYLAFGVPTIVAGLLVPVLTLAGTMMTLGALILILAVVAHVMRVRIPDQHHAA